MRNRHRYPNQPYRPSPEENDGLGAIADAHALSRNVLLRALVRALIRQPARMMKLIAPDIQAVRDDTPKGRPRKGEPAQGMQPPD